MEHQFDELAKALAEEMSRRGALRRLGLGLAGAALAAWALTTKAEAQIAKTGDCRTYCREGCANNARRQQCAEACRNCTGGGGTFTINSCTAALLDTGCAL